MVNLVKMNSQNDILTDSKYYELSVKRAVIRLDRKQLEQAVKL